MRTYPGCVPNWVRTYPRGYCTVGALRNYTTAVVPALL
jgi:hypothetical protein